MSPLHNSAESTLVTLAKLRDRAAFSELVSRRQSLIRNLLRRLSGNPQLADELAQEVFLKMWTKLPDLQQVGAFGGWLQQIAINMWKQKLRSNDPLESSDSDEILNLEASKASKNLKIDLDRALLHLKAPVRLCIVLAYNEGMTHNEISEAADLPLGTVKSHIKRGSAELQKLLLAYQEKSAKSSNFVPRLECDTDAT